MKRAGLPIGGKAIKGGGATNRRWGYEEGGAANRRRGYQ